MGEILPDFVTDASENGESLFMGALERGRVFEVAVNRYGVAWEDGAAFLGIVTNGENVVERLAGELVDAFRAMARDVDAQLSHGRDRFRSNLARLDPGAENLEAISRIVPQQAFSHLASG